MIKSLDLRNAIDSKRCCKSILMCDTDLDNAVLERNLFGVYKLDIESYPNAKNYVEMTGDEIREYIKGYYENVLSKLNPEKVAMKIRYSLLVSDERTDSLAKRHILAEWINLFTEEEIEETSIEEFEDGSIQYTNLQRPKFIRRILEDVIKSSKDMKGFESLRALYLFEKAEMLDDVADRFEDKFGETSYEYLEYRQAADYLRCDAEEIDADYIDEVMTGVRKRRGYSKRTIRVSSK